MDRAGRRLVWLSFLQGRAEEEGGPGGKEGMATATWCGSAARSLQEEDGGFPKTPLRKTNSPRTSPSKNYKEVLLCFKIKTSTCYELIGAFKHFVKM